MQQSEQVWQYKWEARFLELAKLVASWSKDEAHQVGAVIVNQDKRAIGLGYNGPPSGCISEGPDKSFVIHAELNAILNSHASVRECTMYIYPFLPCASCAATIVQAGITRVVSGGKPVSNKWHPDAALQLLKDSGVLILTAKE